MRFWVLKLFFLRITFTRNKVSSLIVCFREIFHLFYIKFPIYETRFQPLMMINKNSVGPNRCYIDIAERVINCIFLFSLIFLTGQILRWRFNFSWYIIYIKCRRSYMSFYDLKIHSYCIFLPMKHITTESLLRA